MDKKILKNTLYSVLYQVVVILLPFITIPFVNAVLGNAVLSIETVISNRIQWFRILGILGVHNYGNRQIARVRDDKELLSKTFFEIYFMQFLLLAFSTICYFLFLQGIEDNLLISYLQILTLVSNMLDITWFFYGVENFKQASLRNITVKIVGVILIFTFIKSPDDLPLYVLINGTTAVLGQLIMWVQMRKYVHRVKVKFSSVLSHIKPNIMFFIPQMATDIYNVLPITMMDVFGKGSETNLFKQAKQLVLMFHLLITSTGQVLLSRISNLHAKQEDEKVEEILQTIMQYSLLLAIPMMFGIVAVMPMFVPWFYSYDAEFLVVIKLVWILAPTVVFITVSNIYGIQYLMPLGKMKVFTLTVSMAAIINLVIDFICIPSLGMYGAAFGVLGAELAVVIAQWVFVHKEIHLFNDKTEIVKFIIAGVAMSFIVYLVGDFLGLKDTKLIALGINAVQAVIGVVIYFIMLWVMKSSTLVELLKKVRGA